MSNKLEDYGKAEELAMVIEMMKPFILSMDLDYAKEVAEEFRKQASFEDSAAVLNPLYNPLKPRIIRKQSESLTLLINFVESLKEIQGMKDQLAKEQATQQDIMKMFW